MRLSLGIAAAVALASCRFDASVPDTATIRCTSVSECPSGRSCSGKLGLCIKENGDKDAPTFLSVAFAPASVGRASQSSLVFTTNEPLLNPPTFTANGFVLLSRLVASGGGETFTYSYAPAEAATEGRLTVIATLIDLAGNERDAELPPITLDFTPPRVIEGSLTASPDLSRPGEDVILQVSFTEPLGRAPQVTVANRTFEARALGTSDATFQVRIPQGTPNGALDVMLSAISDAAGNETAPGTVGRIRVDSNQPRITTLEIIGGATVRSAQPGFNTFTVIAEGDVGTAFDLRSLEVTFGGNTMSCRAPNPNRRECDLTVLPTMAEGQNTIEATATGATGSSTRRSITVTLDFTPPSLISGTVVPAFTPGSAARLASVTTLGPMARFDLVFSVSEPLGEPARVSLDTANMTCTVSGTSQTCSYTHDCGALPDGRHGILISLADAVGNRFIGGPTGDAISAVKSDCVSPNPPKVATAGAVIWQRAPFGSVSSAARPGAWLKATAQAVDEPDLTVLVGNDLGSNTLDAIATGVVSSTGETVIRPAPGVDRVAVWVQAVDRAGNGSQVVKVVEYSAHVPMRGSSGATLTAPLATMSVATDDVTLENPAEAYNRAAAPFATLNRLNFSAPPNRSDHRMVALGNSKVLMVGGKSPAGTPLGDSWVYDGLTNQWLPTVGSQPQPRAGAQLVSLGGGRALIFGGGDATLGAFSDSWVYDLATNTWSVTPGLQPGARTNHAMVSLGNGKALLFGGLRGTAWLQDTWVFDGATNTWADVSRPGAPGARAYHRLVLLDDGSVLLVGGLNNAGFQLPARYRPGEAVPWVTLAPGGDSLGLYKKDARAVPIGANRVLVVGGTSGYLNDAVVVDVANNTTIVTTGEQPTARTGMRAARVDATHVVVFGGRDDAFELVGDSWSLDTTSLVWSKLTGAKPNVRELSELVTFDDTKAVLFGGTSSSLGDTWLFDGSYATWSNVIDDTFRFITKRTATSLDDGRLLLAGTTAKAEQNAVFEVLAGDPVPRWQPQSGLRPTARYNTILTTLGDGNVLLFGGFHLETTLLDTWLLDRATLTWAEVTALGPGPAAAGATLSRVGTHQAVLLDATGACFVFDDRPKTWSPCANSPSLTLPGQAAPLGAHDALFCEGIVSRSGVSQTWRFADSTASWVRLGDLPVGAGRELHALAGGPLVLLNGTTASLMTDTMSMSTWEPVDGVPSGLKISQGFAAPLGDRLLVTGGMTATDGYTSTPLLLDTPNKKFITPRWSPLPIAGAPYQAFAMGNGRVLLTDALRNQSVVNERGGSTTAVLSVALSDLGISPSQVVGVAATAQAGAAGFTSAGAAKNGAGLQVYGANDVGSLFTTCAVVEAADAAVQALSCTPQAFTGRTRVAVRVTPLGASNGLEVPLVVDSLNIEVLYR